MLFKLKNKMKRLFCNLILIAILFFVLANVEAAEQKLRYHGFISQGLIDVDGSNFVNDNGEVSSELTELGINASYQLSSNFRLAGQVVYLNGGNRYAEGTRIDYALIDWLAYTDTNWRINIYLGRFKNNHWLYSSSRDVPFARPSIILPQSIYFDGFRDIAVGADGAAIKISRSDDDYGNFDFNFSYGSNPISSKQADIILSKQSQGTVKQDFEAQASFYWQPLFSPWRFGVSYLDSDFTYRANKAQDLFFDGSFSFQTTSINTLYEGEQWEFSGEFHESRFTTKGFFTPTFLKNPISHRWYVQSRYKLNHELTLLMRYETFASDKNDKNGNKMEQETNGLVPAYFAYHDDTTIGLSYDLSSNFRVRFEYHWFQGTGRLTPVVLPNPTVNNRKNWQLWAVQLMYWF